ncbi:related to YPT31-GTP-binding protein of the rab family [Sporisorium reilianum SRZ2]|uniref:Related to YPT31-GTP-binding protein of the rab family n=1 Tax=Sporisorium reilianum (strain SRZ2) TaxID=999809 RepID=E6ZYV5_SPORE|nr:related to YPT31-GTP-binding protein of the rab family [Sporisorium reilianum SRZ2]
MAPIRIPSGTYASSSAVSAGASTAPPSSGWDYILKFILIGDSSVGKSSLLVRLTDDRFLADPDPTIGVEFGSHLIRLDNGETVKVQVWDTAGSESFRSITRSYYRGAAGALLVYDVTHRASFLNVKGWLDDVRAHAEEKVSVVLVGNMLDLVQDEVDEDTAESEELSRRRRMDRRRSKGNKREVSTQEAQEFASREGLLFVEASAKTGHNVAEAFAMAARDVHSKFESPDSAAGARGDGGVDEGARAAARYDTLGKRSRMRAVSARTSGTVTLDSDGTQQARSVSGFSIRSLTGAGSAQDGERTVDSQCCVIC